MTRSVYLKEFSFTTLGLLVTVTAFFLFLKTTVPGSLFTGESSEMWAYSETFLFIGIVGFLVYGNLVYQLTRLGYLSRKFLHQSEPRKHLETLLHKEAPVVTVLVPSYREEPEVVLQTLISAALQEYSQLRVVLLIDDPPKSPEISEQHKLQATQRLPGYIQGQLDQQKEIIDHAFDCLLGNKTRGNLHIKQEIQRLVGVLQKTCSWYDYHAREMQEGTHTDQWFAQKILHEQREKFARHERQFIACLHDRKESEILERIESEYRLLQSIFSCRLSSFERKRYSNLSHEPNKAMNLNTYIGLMGSTVCEQQNNQALRLQKSPSATGTFIPDADYILTLDADSLLLPDYALRLVYFLNQPQHSRIAVAQTPYSAIPKAPQLLERTAGATTDIQYIIHQGFTAFDGTYWVGANALLRKTALEDIARTETHGDKVVTKFIQDRTVIEDTESSIDLITQGWQLYNYPERLAYSATPPDFGSLLIQRRRWANGGLLILPKLLRYLVGRPRQLRKLWQGFVQCHYLTSIAGVNFGVLALLLYPFDDQLKSLWLPLTAIPYYFLYGRDLTLNGYTWKDLPRVYALNLLLIPVHIGGVSKSLHQAFTKIKSPFCRTPKIPGRTLVPVFYLAVVYGLLGALLCGAIDDFFHEYWMHMTFAIVNGGFLLYAVIQFIGIRSSWEYVLRSFIKPRSLYAQVASLQVFSQRQLRNIVKEGEGPKV